MSSSEGKARGAESIDRVLRGARPLLVVSVLAAALVLAPGARADSATISLSGATITVAPIDEGPGCRGRVSIDTLGGSPAKYQFVSSVTGEGTACSGLDAGSGCDQVDLEVECLAGSVTQLVLNSSPQGQSYEVEGSFSGDTFDFNGGPEDDRAFPSGTTQMTSGDTLDGEGGDDELSGGGGGDTINGQAGNDDIDGGAGGDIIDAGADADGFALGTDVLGGAGIDNINGGSDSAGDELKGGTEGDTINGGGGVDTIAGDAGVDTLNGGGGVDTIGGNAGVDTLNGDAGNDNIDGDEDGDTLNGGSDDDDLVGDLGNDTLNGNEGDDELKGDGGADAFNGGEGVEGTVGGNSPGDTVSYLGRATPVGVDIGGGADDGRSPDDDNGLAPTAAEDNVGTDIENLIGGGDDDELRGDGLANTLDGRGGDDQFAGGQQAGPDGKDTFVGDGDGTDTAPDAVSYVDRADDLSLVIGNSAATTDQDALNGIDDLTGGTGSDALIGTAAINTFEGGPGSGSDTLSGAGGDDFLIGGTLDVGFNLDGADTYIGGEGGEASIGDSVLYTNRTDDLVVDIGGGANDPGGDNVGADVENVFGGSGDDRLTGDNQNNQLSGLDGTDVVAGGATDAADGDDQLSGGSEAGTSDTVSYAHRSAGLDIVLDSGLAIDGTDTDTLTTFENVVGSGGDNTIIGNDSDNVLNGGPGDDSLNGGFQDSDEADGADTYIGGEGNENDFGDSVNYGHRASPVTADIGGALDQDGDEVRTDVESLAGGSADDTLGGDGGANLIEGGTGGDIINPGGGADNVTGGEGNDTFNTRDGVSDTIDCGENAGDSDTVNGDQTPAEIFVSAPACEVQNLINVAPADLSLTMTVDNPTPSVGQQVTFTLTVTASANATGVLIADVLPAGLTYVSDTPGAPYNEATGVWNAGSVLASTPESITITATKTAAGTIQNVAEVSASDQLDPDSTPNNGTVGEDDRASVTLTDPPPPPPPPPVVVQPTAVPPSNSFTTAGVNGQTLRVNVSSAGTVQVIDAGAGAAGSSAIAAAKRLLKPSSASGGPPTITVKLKLTKLGKQRLRQKGKVRVNARITFTPNGGTPNSQTSKLKIRKR